MLNVAPSLIRFWETEFDVIRPIHNRKGDPKFSSKDLKNLQQIHHFIKKKGFTLERTKLELQKEFDLERAKRERIESLKKVKHLLMQLRDQL